MTNYDQLDLFTWIQRHTGETSSLVMVSELEDYTVSWIVPLTNKAKEDIHRPTW